MAAGKRNAKGGHKPPEGKVRLGQVVMTFGPGAMVDLLDHAVLVGGTDFWRYDKYKDQGFIDEPRLRDAIVSRIGSKLGIELSASRAFRLPPAGDDDAPSQFNGIQVAEFPAWFVCQRCRSLGRAQNLEREKGRYVHHCTNAQKGVCTPARFVATCKRGHLDEFPWSWFVHTDAETRCETPDLYLDEEASGDFGHIRVRCRACGKSRKLSEAREPKLLPQCRGDRPWLGPEGREEMGCKESLEMLVRTASSGYFSQWMSALSIPDKAREAVNRVSQADVWTVLQEAQRDELPVLRKVVRGGANGAAGSRRRSGVRSDGDDPQGRPALARRAPHRRVQGLPRREGRGRRPAPAAGPELLRVPPAEAVRAPGEGDPRGAREEAAPRAGPGRPDPALCAAAEPAGRDR
jgi:hypothetical protein